MKYLHICFITLFLVSEPLSGTELETDPGCVDLQETTENLSQATYPAANVLELYAGNAFGKGIGIDRNYSSLGVWLARFNEDYVGYLNGQWNHLCNGENGAFGGLGLRFGDVIRGAGVNMYYDWRNYQSKVFNQVSGGIEGWVFPWEFHLNVYFPLNSYTVLRKTRINFLDGYVFSSNLTAYPCKIATYLAGRQFNLHSNFIPHLTCIALAGPYWISNKIDQNKYGVYASLDFHFYDYFSWKTIGSNDPIFDTRVETVLTLQIPFGCRKRSACECGNSLYNRRPERLDFIAIDPRKQCHYNWPSP